MTSTQSAEGEGPDIATPETSEVPERAGLVLAALIMVAAVANLNLSVANVALPSIGKAFDASQTSLNLIAVGYSLGLAASVLYLGAVGDRYGRKLLLILGVTLSVPACLFAAYAPSDEALALARILGGISAGMAYPTTLALITALWAGPARTKSIALWSALGGAIAALGPLISGFLLEHFWWGSVFLITLPLAGVALLMAWFLVPAHVNEDTDPVDNLGGILSVVLVGSLVLSINFIPVAGKGTLALSLGILALAACVLPAPAEARGEPLVRPRRRQATHLLVRGRRRDHRLRVPHGGHVRQSAVPPERARLLHGRGGRGIPPRRRDDGPGRTTVGKAHRIDGITLHVAVRVRLLFAAFLSMLLLWKEDTPYWQIGIAYAFMGIGVGLAGTPASHSLTGSVPRARAGMASGTADLQRDLGGAIMQSLMGALLTAGYASSLSASIAASPNADKVSNNVESELTKSFASASDTAQQYPQYSSQIIAAAKSAFLDGDSWAYSAGGIAVLLGAVLVFFAFPRKAEEERLLAEYESEDVAAAARREVNP